MAVVGGRHRPHSTYSLCIKVVISTKFKLINYFLQDVIDIDTFAFNLTDANNYPDRTPSWFKLYSMKDAYDLEDLTPQSIHQLADTMFKDEELYCKYWRYVLPRIKFTNWCECVATFCSASGLFCFRKSLTNNTHYIETKVGNAYTPIGVNIINHPKTIEDRQIFH